MAGLGLLLTAAAADAQEPDSLVFALAPASRLEVRTGRAGLLGGLGHEHLVRARAFRGGIVYFPAAPERSSVTITVLTDSLEILTQAKPSDLAKMTRAMREQTLKVRDYPETRFVSREVTPIEGGVRVAGDFTLAGQTRPLTVEVTLDFRGDTLHASTRFALKQTDFGMRPYSTALGTVKVADAVRFELEVLAVRQ
ncbi:MAG TPA: YceI family protein [Gemmatimonadales bacterium]|nr:YceI family protein [Gemmatimonadales bacterium]